MDSIRKIAVGAALALLLAAAPASAAFLTFVSATGNDSLPCTVEAQPCKTLQRAVNQTSTGGEVQILSRLPTQAATIARSITVNGGGNTLIGRITINNAAAIVRLRRLSLTGRHAVATGINIVNAAAVHIEECSVERYLDHGILLGENVATELFISDSVIRDNGNFFFPDAGLRVEGPSAAKVAVEDSLFLTIQTE